MPLLMCPNDNASMQTLNRNGVEFDMCPACRGVWLDRGELEKLMQGARDALAGDASKIQAPPRHERRHEERHDERTDRDDRRQYERGRRRGFDLFDIFD